MTHRQGFRQISFEVTSDFYDQIENYCTENNEHFSAMCRRAVRRELSYDRDFELLRECEKLIDQKLEKFVVIPTKAKKIGRG